MSRLLFVFACIAIIFSSLYYGHLVFSWRDLLVFDSLFFDIRVSRVLTGFAYGAVISLAGCLYQTLFRNDLASPFTLGVSSGVSFGAGVGIFVFNAGAVLIQTLGFIGGILSTIFLYLLSKLFDTNRSSHIILSGVVLSFFFGSLILISLYIFGDGDISRYFYWTMGSFGTIGFKVPIINSIALVILLLGFLKYHRVLDHFYQGDTFVKNLGHDATVVRWRLMILSSISLALVVSQCGPIGFVGIMIPHFVKMYGIYRHRDLMIWTAVFGGIFTLFCDLIARVSFQTVAPIGVVTSTLGVPFFLFILYRSRRV